MRNRSFICILFCVASLSCQRGRPARKELPPSLNSLPEIGSTVTPFPSRWSLFISTDTSLLINGIRHDFLVLAIPDPGRDSTIGTLISSGESLAPYLLSELNDQKKFGVVIDLRVATGTPTIRQDYSVTSPTLNITNLPIVFLSDQYSVGRAAFYSQYLEQFPGASWSITTGKPGYQNDCFKD